MRKKLNMAIAVLLIVLSVPGMMPGRVAAAVRPPEEKQLGASSHVALVRLEDVSPWYALNPKRLQILRYVADYLAARHVPFQVAMVPVYMDPEAGIRLGIDTPEDPRAKAFIDTIHYMMSKGGTIGLHGYTHQMDEGVTGDSIEFSNDEHTIESTTAYMVPRVEAALEAAKAAGIPIAFWETPHYTASPEQYTYLESKFRIIYEPGPSSHYAKEPFTLSCSGRITCFVPTPLGMVQGPRQVQALLAYADGSHTRPGLASFFFHPFRERLPSAHGESSVTDETGAYLEQIIPAFQKHGYTFISVTALCGQLTSRGTTNRTVHSVRHAAVP